MKTNKIKSLKRTTKILSCILLMIFMSSHYCNSQSIQEEVEAYMQVQRKLDNFSGSILLAKDNDILFSKSYGMASYEHNVKNTPQTKFRIASMTKQFTAMAIMQLCEKGFLDINDKLSKFIPDFPQGDDITIHQLLIHTSGVLDFLYTTEYQNIKTVKTPLSDIIDIIKAQPLEFSPGERTEYSNSGYVILGYIIEEVSGSSYEDYLHQNIFGPLDMGNTCCSDYNDIIINRASGYSVGHDGIINADYTDMSFADGSGWLYSTTEDLYLWDRALYTQKILSKDYMEKIFTPYNEKKGYGWVISEKNGRRKTSASGRVEGFHTRILRYPDENACIIVLSNYYHGKVSTISKDLASIMFGDEYKIPEVKQYITITGDDLFDYAGNYEFEPGNNLKVLVENGKLLMAPPGQPLVELFPESETRFHIKAFDAYLEFQKDEKGVIKELVFLIGGNKMKARKI